MTLIFKKIETEKEADQMTDVLMTRRSFQYTPKQEQDMAYVAEKNREQFGSPGITFFGAFQDDILIAFCQFQEWYGYEGNYSRGIFSSRAGINYPRTYDGVNADLRIDLTNYGIIKFEKAGFHTSWTISPNRNDLQSIFKTPQCRLCSHYDMEVTEIVPANTWFTDLNKPIGGEWANKDWKRSDYRNYLIPIGMLQEQKILKFTLKKDME